MRLMFCPHAYAPSIGGAQAYTRGLAEGMVRRGHEVHVVVADIDDPEAFYELGHRSLGIPTETLAGVAVHRIPMVTMGYRWGRAAKPARGLRSARFRFRKNLEATVQRLRPDCVVTLPHLFPNVEDVFALRSGAPWRVVYVPMLHEDDSHWSIPPVSAAVAAADGVVALTAYEHDRLLAAYGANPEHTGVVAPGVELPITRSDDARSDYVLFLGRRTASKRIDVLVAAMAIVHESHPGVRLVIAGPPPAVDQIDLRRSGVEIVDAPDDRIRRQLLRGARVVVSASTVESFGIVTLEAWAHATPVVVVDTPVSRSVVRSGVDGVLAGSDAAGLARGIVAVLDDPARAAAMGRAGRERAAREFTWDVSSAALDRIIAPL